MAAVNRALAGVPDKQALVMALAERARRKSVQQQIAEATRVAAMASSAPVRGKYTSLLDTPGHPFNDLRLKSDYKVLYGGRDSAKSWGFAERAIELASTGRYRILCTREFQNSISDSVHRLLRDTIERMGLTAWFHITEKSISCPYTGSEFLFKGLHHNVHEVKSTEGVDICWVEEAQHTSDESWSVLIPTIRKEGAEIWISFNVTDETAPTHVRFVESTPPDTIIHKVDYTQNPYLSSRSKAAIAFLKASDIHAFEHVYLGYPKKMSDSVIFGGRYVIEEFPADLYEKAERLFYGADFGFARDPSTLIRCFILDNVLYIEYEAYGVGVEFAGNMTPDGRGELEQLYDSVPGSRDWPIKGDEARPETISFLRNKGFPIEAAAKWKGCVEDGIAHIKGFTRVVIHPRCKWTQTEARLYSYKVDRVTGDVLPIVVDKHNHIWDAIRYSLDGHILQGGDVGIMARLGQ